MTRNKFFQMLLSATVICLIYSVAVIYLIENFKTYHWYYSLVFFQILFSALFLFRKSGNDGQTNISNIMTSSVGRLLLSAIAFLIYGYAFPFSKNAMIAHFIPHYFIFTGIELYFLLKLAKNDKKHR